MRVTEPELTTEATLDAAPRARRVGLEPLGSDVLIEGMISGKALTDIVVTTPTFLPAGARAFIVIDDPGGPPIVGLVEVVDQQVLTDDVAVELRTRIVRMSDDNRARLAQL